MNNQIVENYRGFDIEKFGDGYIIEVICGDEIYCDTVDEAENIIDEYYREDFS